MTTENLPKEGGAGDMDRQEGIVEQQHARFRALFEQAVAKQREYFPDSAQSDWLIQCCDSFEVFVRCFPDRERFEEQLRDLEDGAQSFAEAISAQIERIQREGLSYFDCEILRHGFPGFDDAREKFERPDR